MLSPTQNPSYGSVDFADNADNTAGRPSRPPMCPHRAKSNEDSVGWPRGSRRQGYFETSAALGPISSLYVSLHLHDDPPADAKSETGALAAGLRGDERIEQMRHDMVRDAGTAVGDRDLHEVDSVIDHRRRRHLDDLGRLTILKGTH